MEYCNKDGATPRAQTQPQKPYSASNSGVQTTQRNTVPIPPIQRTDSFWTICSHCEMRYEYWKVYLNVSLRCRSCRNSFMAVEIVPPAESFPYLPSQQSNRHFRNHAPSSNIGENNVATNSPRVASKFNQQANSRVKRRHEEARGSTLKGEAFSKRRVLNGDDLQSGNKPLFQMPMENSRYSTRKMTALETRKMLIDKALTEIRKKRNEWKSEAPNKAAAMKKVKERRVEEIISAMKCCALSSAQSNGIGKTSSTKRDDKNEQNLGGISVDDGKSEVPGVSMNVPDPVFHDFDLDRTEMSFEDNQIWAAYDDDDGMPRLYAFVQKVISNDPFKLRISWLASKSNSEFGSVVWVSSGFAKSCGEFRIRKYEVSKSLNTFSHKVKWTKGARGVILIVPQKGDIWALYRNWSSDWNVHTPNEVIHKYDMVEVLDDYNEEQGVHVTPLVKVAGFRTVFRPHQSEIMTIRKEEMFRFSHQVPNYVLTGQEGQNAPKGCQELDPAATPLELFYIGDQ